MRDCATNSSELTDWDGLVAGIRRNDESAIETFYRLFSSSLRAYFSQRLVDHAALADCTSECLVTALSGIHKGSLREPSKMTAYVWGIARNILRKAIQFRIAEREMHADVEVSLLPNSAPDQEADLLLSEQRQIISTLMSRLSPLGREILRRFYLEGDTPRQIQVDLGITETQFRLAKNRAKMRLLASSVSARPSGSAPTETTGQESRKRGESRVECLPVRYNSAKSFSYSSDTKCAIATSERHLGHAYRVGKTWLAYDATQSDDHNGIRFLGQFSDADQALREIARGHLHQNVISLDVV